MKTKRLDSSNLTDKEKRHSVSLILVATFTAITGISLSWATHNLLIASIMVAAATGIIGFVWGYIGAMEDERSGRA